MWLSSCRRLQRNDDDQAGMERHTVHRTPRNSLPDRARTLRRRSTRRSSWPPRQRTPGGLGSFGANYLEPEGIAEVTAGIRQLTSGPFALNLWVPLPSELEPPPTLAEYERTVALLRPFYDEVNAEPPSFREVIEGAAEKFGRQVDALLAARPPVFSFIFGIPPEDVLKECRRLGIVTLGTVTNVMEAEAMAAAGVDVIVASGTEAGGHRASFLRSSAESLGVSALVPQIADRVSAPIVAAGGIVDGRGAVAAFVLGAHGVQVGTGVSCHSGVGRIGASQTRAGGPRRTQHRADARLQRPACAGAGEPLCPTDAAARGVASRLPVAESADVTAREGSDAKAGVADLLPLWAGQNVPLVKQRSAAELMAFLVDDIDRVADQALISSRRPTNLVRPQPRAVIKDL